MGQLKEIIAVLGTPSDADLETIDQKLVGAIRSLPVTPPLPLRELFNTDLVPDDGIDLLAALLRFDPDNRATAAGALGHTYLAQMHDEESEAVWTGPGPLREPDALADDRALDWPTLRCLVEEEAARYVAVGAVGPEDDDDDGRSRKKQRAAPAAS